MTLAAAVALLAAAAPAAATPSPAPARPSVLLVTLDTTRADHLGCYGAASAATPNVDALAKGGARFDAALSPVPLTFPAHATIMTGRLPRRHGVRDNALFRLEPGIPLLAESFRAAGYRTAAFVSAAVVEGDLGLARGFDRYDDAVGFRESPGAEPERRGDLTAQAAIDYLATAAPPFFVWVHLFDPHAPYAPPEPYATRFKGRPYDGEIAFADAQLGRVVAAARARHPALLVAVAGDHGESLGEHGEETHGVFVYQATQRVPLILEGAGVPPGRVVPDTVGLIDLAPTLAAWAGVAPPAGADGRSLLASLGAGARPAPRDFELESYFPLFSYGWAPVRALVRGSLKLIDAPRPELYDLARDPAETSDVRRLRKDDAQRLTRALYDRIEGDTPAPRAMDPALAEHAQRIASLGYVGGSSAVESVEVVDPKDGIRWIADLVLGREALNTGRPAEGIPPLERLVAKNPSNLPALMTLGACYQDAGRIDDAVKLQRRALALYPESATTWLNLAQALSAKAKGDRAVLPELKTAYERALAIDSRSAEALRGLSRLAFEAGDYPAAERHLARELAVRPTASAARALGDLRAKKLSDPAGAREAYRRAAELTPPGDPARKELLDLARPPAPKR